MRFPKALQQLRRDSAMLIEASILVTEVTAVAQFPKNPRQGLV